VITVRDNGDVRLADFLGRCLRDAANKLTTDRSRTRTKHNQAQNLYHVNRLVRRVNAFISRERERERKKKRENRMDDTYRCARIAGLSHALSRLINHQQRPIGRASIRRIRIDLHHRGFSFSRKSHVPFAFDGQYGQFAPNAINAIYKIAIVVILIICENHERSNKDVNSIAKSMCEQCEI